MFDETDKKKLLNKMQKKNIRNTPNKQKRVANIEKLNQR